MKPLLLFVGLVTVFFLPGVQAISLGENLYIALPPETIQCIDIFLPDNAGVFTPGLIDYVISSDAQWADLTEQTITTDENNTVKVPLCLSSFGRSEGECTNSYSIVVAAPSLGVAKSFGGGACVSQFPDVDYAEPSPGESPLDVLNNNADLFDLAFKNPVLFIQEGDVAPFTLLVQSYATVTLDLAAQGLSPATTTISLSADSPKATVEFTTTKHGEVTVTARIRDCSGSFCSKKTTGEVKAAQELAGFSLSLFPSSLNIKNLDPVTFELIITNFEEEKEFEVQLILPPGMESGFTQQSLLVAGEQSIEFEITPQSPSSLYLITLIVTADGNTKTASATLSTNELLTDALREAEAIKQENPEAGDFIDSTIDSWYQSYQGKEYGKELGDYAQLKSELAKAKASPSPQKNITLPPPPPQAGDNTIIFVIAGIIIAVVAVAVFFVFRKSGKGKEVEVAEIEEGF